MKPFSEILDRAVVEPFRFFFPLGLAASAFGVLLWPAYFAGWIGEWPLEAHARWMVIGFGGCLVTGFLGTAGPRLLGAEPWFRCELLCHGTMALAVMACLAGRWIAAADWMAGLWLGGVLLSMAYRVLGAREWPPPGLAVAVLGVAGAALAGFALGLDPILTHAPGTRLFWRLLYFQGLLWLPAIGVAPYLLPRFFGRKSPHAFDDDEKGAPPGWWRAFFGSFAAGLAVVASFAVEAWWGGRSGMPLRAAVVVLYLGFAVPGLAGWSRANGLGWALRWVVPCAAGGWLLAAKFGPLRTGMLHLMFIGGAGLLMLSVATRVALGHAERHDRLAGSMRWFHGVWGMVLFTAATRLSSDFLPRVRNSHYVYAALLWVALVAFHGWMLRRELRRPDPRLVETRRGCPRRSGGT